MPMHRAAQAGLWVEMLDQYLTESRPELVAEMGDNYLAFLISRTDEATELMIDLIHDGMDPHTARELAIRDMMEEVAIPEEEQQSPETTPRETGDIQTETSSAEG